MKIIYIPLDERPCNADYPGQLMEGRDDVTLLTLPGCLRGKKKQPAPVGEVFRWLDRNLSGASAVVISAEMLFYGGLLPSRLHCLDEVELGKRLESFREIWERHGRLPVYLFSLIMRSPSYSSDDEEPGYYGRWGREIHQMGAIKHRKALGLDYDSALEKELLRRIPADDLADYETRRGINYRFLEKLVMLKGEGVLRLLAVPQDDTAPYGYPSWEREQLFSLPAFRNKDSGLYNYPGADEAGCSLCGRALLDLEGRKIPVKTLISHEEGLDVIPRFEDRPLRETIAIHRDVAGLNETDGEPVLCMAYNLPVEKTEDGEHQDYESDLADPPASVISLVEQIAALPGAARIILTDIRFTNGADRLLLHLLDESNLLDRLDFYSAWNTCGNAIGTACGAAAAGTQSKKLLKLRILEDHSYMSCARAVVRPMSFPSVEDESAAARQRREKLARITLDAMKETVRRELPHSISLIRDDIKVSFPWSRCFEIALEMNDGDSSD